MYNLHVYGGETVLSNSCERMLSNLVDSIRNSDVVIQCVNSEYKNDTCCRIVGNIVYNLSLNGSGSGIDNERHVMTVLTSKGFSPESSNKLAVAALQEDEYTNNIIFRSKYTGAGTGGVEYDWYPLWSNDDTDNEVNVAAVVKEVLLTCPGENSEGTVQTYIKLATPKKGSGTSIGNGNGNEGSILSPIVRRNGNNRSAATNARPSLSAVSSAFSYVEQTMDAAATTGMPPSPIKNIKKTIVDIKPDGKSDIQTSTGTGTSNGTDFSFKNAYSMATHPNATKNPNGNDISNYFNEIGIMSDEDFTYLEPDQILIIADMLKPIQKKKFIEACNL